jgi:hypothetical protein
VEHRLTLRNQDGSIWIIISWLPEPFFTDALNRAKNWTKIETGSASGCPFTVLKNKDSTVIVFPTLQMTFSLALTTKGNTDKVKMLKWFTPPEGKEYNAYLAKAKEAAFAVLSQMSHQGFPPDAPTRGQP